MAIKYLNSHWFVGGVSRLSTSTGKSYRSIKYRWPEAPDKGSAWRQGFKRFYQYESQGIRCLQYKKNIWPNDTDHKFQVRQLNRRYRQFRVEYKGGELFKLKYKVKGYWFAQFDPTYDALDAESDDFFLVLLQILKTSMKVHQLFFASTSDCLLNNKSSTDSVVAFKCELNLTAPIFIQAILSKFHSLQPSH